MAVFGVLGFSFKAILIKLAYAWYPVDAVTLLALRMLYSAPFFIAMVIWAGRGAKRLTGADLRSLAWLGFIGYYLASLLDFMGLEYITAALERLVLFLYPTIVVLLSAWIGRTPITRRAVTALAVSYIGILLVVAHDMRISGEPRAIAIGGGLVFGGAILYALYLVQATNVIRRLGSMRFIAWAMMCSTVFVFGQFVLTRPLSALAVPPSIHLLVLTMAIFSTVLPTFMTAEALKRVGANQVAILGEPLHWIQLVGAALVLVGVTLVTLKR